jgi:ADP-ribose pyrophosphatase
MDETMAIYLARGLKRGEAHPEEDEAIRVRFFPMSGAIRMVRTSKIRDGKTIIGVLWFHASTVFSK